MAGGLVLLASHALPTNSIAFAQGKDPAAAPAPAREERDKLIDDCLRQAEALQARGEGKLARAQLDRALGLDKSRDDIRLSRARLLGDMRQSKEAVADYDILLSAQPDSVGLLNERGAERFKAGLVKESLEDFDKVVRLRPETAKSHWQRGIACYYVGRFTDGRKQFEQYQDFDNNDVENAVWRFICMVPESGFDKARADILKIGDDRRVPMRQVYDLFAGKLEPEAVLATAKTGGEKAQHHQLFYAHQYLGLYYEARGDKAKALEHTREAVARPIAHYMWDVANVHLKLREAEAKK